MTKFFSQSRSLALLAIATLLMLIAVGVSHVRADDDKACKREQDCALNATQKREIRPLPEVLAVAREKLPGEVVKIELEREDGIWVYEIKVLTPQGKRREIEIDAKTLKVIKID